MSYDLKINDWLESPQPLFLDDMKLLPIRMSRDEVFIDNLIATDFKYDLLRLRFNEGNYASISVDGYGYLRIEQFASTAPYGGIYITSKQDLIFEIVDQFVITDGDGNQKFQIHEEWLYFNGQNVDAADGFRIRVEANGKTSLMTSHYDLGDHNEADLEIIPDGYLKLTSYTGEDVTIDSGNDIILDAASGNITCKDDGGNYTPSSDYHVATKKYVDDTEAGASALNDLSDVSYSSGDLTITSLDTIISGALTLDSSGDITLDADGGEIYLKDDGTQFAIFSTAGSVSTFRMYEDGGATGNDHFTIEVAEHGLTTLTTVDAAATAADLNIVCGGKMDIQVEKFSLDTGLMVSFLGSTNQGLSIDYHHSATNFTLYEDGGASLVDFCRIYVKPNGETTIQTVDAAGTDAHLRIQVDGLLKSSNPLHILESINADSNVATYGQLWVKNETPNELYFTTDAGDDIQITDGTAMAGGGGGTQTWSKTTGGYKTNNNSSSYYYTQYYPHYYNWTRSDSSPTSVDIYSSATGGLWTADKSGTLTNIRVQLRATDTGQTDPLKFYVYKGAVADGTTSTSCTLIGTSSTMTPVASRVMVLSTDISSSNTFSEGDTIWVWLKKDSTSGNSDLYFGVTISGEYD